VFTEPTPPESGPLGLDAKANDFITLIRCAMPDNEHAGHAWWTNLPVTVLRVRCSLLAIARRSMRWNTSSDAFL
jgi:hypothetical protein